MIDVKLFRVVTGEEVVAELVSEDESSYSFKNCLVIIPTPQGTIGFAPWSPVINKSNPQIQIDKKFVVYLAEVEDYVNGKYNEMFGSGIVTPNKKIIL